MRTRSQFNDNLMITNGIELSVCICLIFLVIPGRMMRLCDSRETGEILNAILCATSSFCIAHSTNRNNNNNICKEHDLSVALIVKVAHGREHKNNHNNHTNNACKLCVYVRRFVGNKM